MPITAYTGLPGHGKTSLMVEHLLKEAKAKNPRPLVAYGIDGLKPGLATVLKDPREWNAVRDGETCHCHDTENSAPCEAHVIPNGALIFVDEAWKWFGHLHNATRQTTPPHVLALAEHRHRGIDFVWTMQSPIQIYPFARAMMQDHHHVVRRYGTNFIEVFTWGELNEDVKSVAKRENASRQLRTLPEHAHSAFKSAEVHTIKRRLPTKLIALPLVLVAAAGLLWFALNALRPSNMADRIAGESPSAAQAAPGETSKRKADRPDAKPLTPYEYAQRLLPRFPTMPESAPIYDGRPVVSVPQVFCMSSEAGRVADGTWAEASVICLTEQGTRYSLPDWQAKHLARWGRPYDAFRERRPEPVNVGGAGGTPAAMASLEAARAPQAATGTASAVKVASYGELAVP